MTACMTLAGTHTQRKTKASEVWAEVGPSLDFQALQYSACFVLLVRLWAVFVCATKLHGVNRSYSLVLVRLVS